MKTTYKQALKDIAALLFTNESTGFYSDSYIVNGLKEYLEEFIANEKRGKATWKTRDSEDFKRDIPLLSTQELADVYSLSYQGAKYHKDKYKNLKERARSRDRNKKQLQNNLMN